VTLYIEGFSRLVTATTAPIATGWSDSCRVGLSPTERSRLSTAHRKGPLRTLRAADRYQAGHDPNETIATGSFLARKWMGFNSYRPRLMAGSMRFRGYLLVIDL